VQFIELLLLGPADGPKLVAYTLLPDCILARRTSPIRISFEPRDGDVPELARRFCTGSRPRTAPNSKGLPVGEIGEVGEILLHSLSPYSGLFAIAKRVRAWEGGWQITYFTY